MRFIKGQWYSDGNDYCQFVDEVTVASGIVYMFRIAGNSYREGLHDAVVSNLKPVTLEPDFSNAQVGDECFSTIDGISIITLIVDNSVYINMEENDYGFGGKYYSESPHPILFNSFAQFKAYWAEWELKQKGGSDAQ